MFFENNFSFYTCNDQNSKTVTGRKNTTFNADFIHGLHSISHGCKFPFAKSKDDTDYDERKGLNQSFECYNCVESGEIHLNIKIPYQITTSQLLQFCLLVQVLLLWKHCTPRRPKSKSHFWIFGQRIKNKCSERFVTFFFGQKPSSTYGYNILTTNSERAFFIYLE